MNYLVIQNDGEINVDALRLLGGSTKDGQEKIGIFGTGCKYALARALDLGISIRIFSGTTEIPIKVKDTVFRDVLFRELVIGNYDTGITTRLGIDWEPWFILREFLSNAIDEGGMSYDIARGELGGCTGKTRVYIAMTPEIVAVYDNFNNYFRFDDSRVVLEAPETKDLRIYRRGMLIYHEERKGALFSYQFNDLPINEARVLAKVWSLEAALVRHWKSKATESMVKLLSMTPESFELRCDWDYPDAQPSPAWASYLRGKVVIPLEMAGYFTDQVEKNPVYFPRTLCLWLAKNCPELTVLGTGSKPVTKIKAHAATPFQKAAVDKSAGVLKACGFNLAPIEIVELDPGVMGLALDGKILLAAAALELGQREIIKTLIEEHVHLTTQAKDFTREMQEALLSVTVQMIAQITGEYL